MKTWIPNKLLNPRSWLPSPKCIGVDVGASVIKIARATGTLGNLSIETCLSELPNQTNPPKPTQIESHGLGASWGAFSISDEKIESHEFKLPLLPRSELDTAVAWEIKRTVASPSSVYYDVLATEFAERYELNCVIAPKELVQSRYDQGKSFGLQPRFLETESSALLACASVLEEVGDLDRLAILDLGHSAFRLIFIHHGHVSFTRSLYFGLRTFHQQAAQLLKLELSEMEPRFLRWAQSAPFSSPLALPTSERPSSENAPKEPEIEQIVQESLYSLCEEFRRSEFFARDHRGLEEIRKVALCGGGACLPYLTDYLTKHLSEKEVIRLDPFKTAGAPEGVDPDSGPLWACAIGLSLREGSYRA